MRLLQTEAFVVAAAYLMAGIPVGGVVLMGRVSPAYRLPLGFLCRWWSRFAVTFAIVYIGLIASA